jgi:hypothetical protein
MSLTLDLENLKVINEPGASEVFVVEDIFK